jgi:hypothetical protein
MPRIAILLALCCLALPSAAGNDGSQFTAFAGFELGKVTLGQVAERLGPAKLIESGDAGDYEAKICYRTSLGLVYFMSGEMGGREHQLLGFGVSGNNPALPCAKFPPDLAPKTLSLAGLRRGLTKAEFARVVTTKVQWEGNVGRAFIGSKRPMTQSELDELPEDLKEAVGAGKVQNYFDVVVSVIGTFSGDQLSDFRVWKVETF